MKLAVPVSSSLSDQKSVSNMNPVSSKKSKPRKRVSWSSDSEDGCGAVPPTKKSKVSSSNPAEMEKEVIKKKVEKRKESDVKMDPASATKLTLAIKKKLAPLTMFYGPGSEILPSDTDKCAEIERYDSTDEVQREVEGGSAGQLGGWAYLESAV